MGAFTIGVFQCLGKLSAFLFPVCVVTSPVVLFVCAQSSHVLCTVHLGDDVGGCMSGGIFAMWFAMRLWPISQLSLVLYICISGYCTFFHCMGSVLVVVPMFHLE